MTAQSTAAATDARTTATALWNRWLAMWSEDPDVAHEIIGPGYRVHIPRAIFDTSRIRDAAGMADWVRSFRGLFDGLRYTSDLGPLLDGDLLVCRWRGTAVYRGLTGWPEDVPGTVSRMVGVDILRVADGRVVECWTQGAVLPSVPARPDDEPPADEGRPA